MDNADEYTFAEDYDHQPLDDDCKLLGSLVDDCIVVEHGEELMQKIERVRALAHGFTEMHNNKFGDISDLLYNKLTKELGSLPLEEAIIVARSCGHYLNLSSIAETHHRVRKAKAQTSSQNKYCDEIFGKLIVEGVSPQDLYDKVVQQQVEVVLTAHPTQVKRRTLQHKHTRVESLLELKDITDLSQEEKEQVLEELVREITTLWQTSELRHRKPTPIDEARGGLHTVEQSLWSALPKYLRRLSTALKKHTGQPLPIECTPVRFASWMGGDRDGNPNVTAKVTQDVICLARWIAADLYLREVDMLRFELSLSKCSQELEVLAQKLEENRNSMEQVLQSSHNTGIMGGALSHPIHHQRSMSSAAENGDKDFASKMTSGFPQGMVIGAMPFGDGAMPFADASMHGTSFEHQTPSLQLTGESMDIAFSGMNGASDALASPPRSDKTSPRPAPSPPSQGPPSPLVAGKRPGTSKGVETPAKAGKSKIDSILNPKLKGQTPYRVVLGEMRRKLLNTKAYMEDQLSGNPSGMSEEDYYINEDEMIATLKICYSSLNETGAGIVAEGRLLDLLRRCYAFGMTLMKLDIRQESGRHTEVFDTITTYLDVGRYSDWDEEARIAWLLEELNSKRPLIPPVMPVNAQVQEVLDTMRMVAQEHESLGAYIISMASTASDVLAVILLQREAGMMVAGEDGVNYSEHDQLRVVPLFETLADLENGPKVIRQLFNIPWYRKHVETVYGNRLEVMLGYSDSGKDAGRFAAAWSLFQAQERLVEVCADFQVQLVLFHGRGGTVGRGGGPMYLAIQSQPPGSIQGYLRVTEQGEMVQAKFGSTNIALRQMEIVTTAVLQASFRPLDVDHIKYRETMDRLSAISCETYRKIVFHTPAFLSYFKKATPEAEIEHLNIGSRPARRKKGSSSVKDLRAIPWIFAWTQNRLVLPAWLGIGEALMQLINEGKEAVLREMYEEWPFFQSTVDLIEMVLAKADGRIAKYYEDVLVTEEGEKALGLELRKRLAVTTESILRISGHEKLCENNRILRHLIENRKAYIEPINILQVEILRRLRQDASNIRLREALLITINGIAAGMRNTG